MKKLLIFGIHPFSQDGEVLLSGPKTRTWQFLKPAIEEKCSVTFIGLDSDAKSSEFVRRDFSNIFDTPFISYSTNYEGLINLAESEKIFAEFKPDAVVGVTSLLPTYIASHFADRVPFWADLSGCYICEIQSKAELYNNEQADIDLFHIWKLTKTVLRNADKFSSISNRHRCEIVGQLSMEGRINRFSTAYEFIHPIPCALDTDEKYSTYSYITKNDLPPVVRGIKTAQDDFLILSCGSYNTWMDVETLFYGLEAAMKENPKVKYISTSGGIPGYNEKSYNDFCKLIENSPLKNNFILLGWVDSKMIPQCYKDCDVGINCDRFTYEGTLGSRNRIIHFLESCVPVLTTNITELTEELSRNEFIHTFEIGKPESLKQKILQLAADKQLLKRKINEARNFIISQYNIITAAGDFMQWIKEPKFSPDKKEKFNRQSELPFGRISLNEVEKHTSYFESASNEVASMGLRRRVKNLLNRLLK